MEWLLDNLKLVIFVIVIVVYAFKAMRGQSEARGDDAQPTRRTMPGEQDAAEAERTRQIQEEIRRRILARQRGEDTTASPPPPIFEEEPPPLAIPPPLPQSVPAPAARAEAPDAYATDLEVEQAARTAGILETQRALEEQLTQMRRVRDAALAGAPKLATSAASAGKGRHSSSIRRTLRADLAGPGALRRAVVLREVLGEPVALRTGPAGMTRR